MAILAVGSLDGETPWPDEEYAINDYNEYIKSWEPFSSALVEFSLEAAVRDEADLPSLAREIDVRQELRACEAAGADPMLVAQGLRFIMKLSEPELRSELLLRISEELSKVDRGERIPYRWNVLLWYVKMWWASERVEQRNGIYSTVLTKGRHTSWFGRCSSLREMSDLEEVLAHFLQSFAAYASEAVLLSGLEAKNVEVLLEAFSEAILDYEQQNTEYTPMTLVAQFAATGAPAGVDNKVPSCKEVLQYMMWFAILTSTEHKVVQRGKTQHPKRRLEDISRTAADYGLRVDIVNRIYRIIREHPITASSS